MYIPARQRRKEKKTLALRARSTWNGLEYQRPADVILKQNGE